MTADPEKSAPVLPAIASPSVLPGSGWTAWISGLATGAMAFLAVLTLAAAMAASQLASDWRSDLAGAATVRVSGTPGEQADRVSAVLEVLRQTPGIAEARPLSDAEQAVLLEPWFGEGFVPADLPVPRLIEVILDGDGPDGAALQSRLDLTVSGAVYDDHASWRRPLAAAATGLERLSLVATLLVALTAAGVTAFAARATLMANRSVIETVRLIGADDDFIAGAFVKSLALRAATGGLAGALLGSAAVALLPRIQSDNSALDLSLGPGVVGWIVLLAGIPLVCTGIVWFSARASVRAALRGMP